MADFKARMQWADEGKGNHNPVVVVNGHRGPSPLVLHAKAGDTVRLDTSKSYDPDGDSMMKNWWQQPEIGTATLDIQGSDVAEVSIPQDATGQTLHVVCEVCDQGPFLLKGYQRVIIVVE